MKLNTIGKISIATGVVLFATIGANFAPAQASSVPSSTTFFAQIIPQRLLDDLSGPNRPGNPSNPTVPVPEPLTISGSLAALGIGWQMKRKMNKKGSSS
ncbi:PEP-CTERM sorting domain-containing protein [Brasilonema sp. CT11]|nr:PEP-CTERM sorting domain-containing protein [Brasilonema sp. CT11]